MKKLTKTILKGTIWLGRGTATVMGLAVLLAFTVGLASTALAGTGIGARFNLGKTNTVDFVSTLAGSFSGPMLRIDNDLPDNPRFINSTALDLQVEPGNPPMTVNSSDKVTNLNADQLDNRDSSQFLTVFGKAADSDRLDGFDQGAFLRTTGKAADADRLDGRDSTAFFSGKTYQNRSEQPGGGNNSFVTVSTRCDPGDVAMGGGATAGDFSVTMISSIPESANSWATSFVDNGNESGFVGLVQCADFPPLR